MCEAEGLLEDVLGDFNHLFEKQVADFRRQVEQLEVLLLPTAEPITLRKE